MTDIATNDRDLADFGVDLLAPIAVWVDAPEYAFEEHALIGVAGRTLTSLGLKVSPKILPLRFGLRSDTVAARQANWDALQRHLRGEQRIVFSDKPDRFIRAVRIRGQAQTPTPQAFLEPYLEINVDLFAEDPHYYALAPKLLAIDTGDTVIVPVGTAGAIGILTLWGFTGSVTVTLTSAAGVTLSTTTLTGTLTGTQVLRLDLRATPRAGPTIKRVTGTTIDADAWDWKHEQHPLPRFDVDDAPRITLSAGGGSPQGTLLVREAYS